MIKYLIQYDKENPIKKNVFKVIMHLMVGVYSSEFEKNFRNQENTTELEIERQLSNAVVIKQGDDSFIYQEDTFTVKLNFDLINQKNELISKRKNILTQNKDTTIEIIEEYMILIASNENPAEILSYAKQNQEFFLNNKKIKEEIVKIKEATSLEELAKFT